MKKFHKLFAISASAVIFLTCLPTFGLDKKSDQKNIVSAATAMNNRATRLLTQSKYDEAISIYRMIVANYPDYKLGASNLSAALFNKACDKLEKDKYWEVIDLIEEAIYWDPSNKYAIDGLDRQIAFLNFNPKSRSDRLKLAARAKLRGNKRAAITELSRAQLIEKTPETAEAIDKLKDSVSSELFVHFASKNAQPDIDCRDYMESIQKRLKCAWFPPHLNSSLSVITLFQVDKSGRMKNVILSKPTHNKAFNEAALKAISLAGWCRELPVGLNEEIDILFTFDYNVYGKTALPYPSVAAKESKYISLFKEGKKLYLLKDYRGAIERYRMAALAAPAEFQALTEEHLGDSYYKLAKQSLSTDPSLAIESFRQSLVFCPDYDHAEIELDKALEKTGINSKSTEQREKMVEELIQEKNFEFAMVECKRAFKLSSESDSERLQKKLFEIQNLSQAFKSKGKWESFLKNNPNSVDGKLGLAHCLSEMGDREQARKLLNEVLERNSQNRQAKKLLERMTESN